MASLIDPSKPAGPIAYTADVRANFATAKSEIEALQQSIGNGGGGDGGGPYLPLTGVVLPTSPVGLPAGSLWSNSGVVCVTSSSAERAAGGPYLPLTGVVLPTSPVGLSPATLWNNGGVVCVT
jgi:hypothetical protein